MSKRSARSALIVLLLFAASSIALSTLAPPNLSPIPPTVKAAGLTVHLSSPSGVAGDVITFTATGASTAPPGTLCSISGAPSNVITGFQGQVYTTEVYGSFIVGTGPGGVYTLTITCLGDSGSTPFTVNPSMTISPIASLPSKTVTVTVNGLPSTTTGPCTITSNLSPMVVGASPASCTIPAGSGSATGTFTANPGAAYNSYTITVNFNGGSFPGPSLFYLVSSPSSTGAIVMSPADATPGWHTVSIAGGGFVSTGTTRSCSFMLGGTLTLTDIPFAGSTCTINGSGTLTATGFAVGPSAVSGDTGTISIVDATTPGGPFSVGTFMVDNAVSALGSTTPPQGPTGTLVSIANPAPNKFSVLDAGACSISSNPASVLISSPFCVIDNTGSMLLATFLVSSTAPGGAYTLTVTGSHGDTSQPSPSFTVTPSIKLSQTFGSPPLGPLPATVITITGGGFVSTDTGASCTIHTSSGPVEIVSNPTCTMSGGIITSAHFTVATGALFNGIGGYTIYLDGGGGAGDHATATFSIAPRILLNPASGLAGTSVIVSGSGFASHTGACVTGLSVTPNILFASSPAPTCTRNNDGTLLGSFTVDTGALNTLYTVTATASATSGDSATAQFRVGTVGTTTTTTVNCTPPSVAVGSGSTCTATVTGSSPTGTVSWSQSGSGSVTFSASSCTLSGTSPFQCSVTASGSTVGSVTIQASYGGDSSNNPSSGTTSLPVTSSSSTFSASCTFTTNTAGTISGCGTYTGLQFITVSVSPTSTGPGFFVTVSGSGFNPTDYLCVITVQTPTPFSGTCAFTGPNSGTITGSFTVPSPGPPPGTYEVTVEGNGGDSGFTSIVIGEGATSTSIFTSYTSTSTFSTTTTTSLTSTAFSTSFSTSTVSSTGASTATYTVYSQTTVTGPTTTSITNSPTTTYLVNHTTTGGTTYLTITIPSTVTVTGFITGVVAQTSNASAPDYVGVMGLLVLLGWSLVRRVWA